MKISILIPVFNVEKYIARCLDSIVAQTMDDWEVIIVDDCGADSSMEIAAKYVAKDSRFKIIHHPSNMGLMYARKTGYENAKGEYIVFLDSDDYLPDDALRLLINGIKATESDIYVGAMQSINECGQATLKSNAITGTYNSEPVLRYMLNHQLPHSLCAKIFRRSLFNQSDTLPSFKNQINSEDLMLCYILVTRAQKISIGNDLVYNYYYNSQSSSKVRFSNKQFAQMVRASDYLSVILDNMPAIEDELSIYLKRRTLSLMAQGCGDTILKGGISPVLFNRLSPNHICSQIGVIKGLIYSLLWKLPFLRRISALMYK